MNNLSKIILISSLSILSGFIIVSHTVVAQEENIPISQENSNPKRDNPRTQKQNVAQDTVQTQDTSGDNTAQNPRQRVNAQDSSLPTTPPTDRKDLRCQNYFVPRIQNHQNTFNSKSQGRVTKYNQIATRLENVSIKLVERGVDVATYNSYITELKAKINSLDTLNQEYIALFGANTNIEEFCNDKEKRSSEMEVRKEKLKLVIAQDKEIRMYIKDTIIVYLRSVNPQTNAPDSSLSTPPTNNNQVLPQQ